MFKALFGNHKKLKSIQNRFVDYLMNLNLFDTVNVVYEHYDKDNGILSKHFYKVADNFNSVPVSQVFNDKDDIAFLLNRKKVFTFEMKRSVGTFNKTIYLIAYEKEPNVLVFPSLLNESLFTHYKAFSDVNYRYDSSNVHHYIYAPDSFGFDNELYVEFCLEVELFNDTLNKPIGFKPKKIEDSISSFSNEYHFVYRKPVFSKGYFCYSLNFDCILYRYEKILRTINFKHLNNIEKIQDTFTDMSFPLYLSEDILEELGLTHITVDDFENNFEEEREVHKMMLI